MNTIIQIQITDVKRYPQKKKLGEMPLPNCCPDRKCQSKHSLVVKDYYPRYAVGFKKVYRIFIRRVKCRVCQKSFIMLPIFLLPYRIFIVPFIKKAQYLYKQVKKSLRQVVKSLSIRETTVSYVSIYYWRNLSL